MELEPGSLESHRGDSWVSWKETGAEGADGMKRRSRPPSWALSPCPLVGSPSAWQFKSLLPIASQPGPLSQAGRCHWLTHHSSFHPQPLRVCQTVCLDLATSYILAQKLELGQTVLSHTRPTKVPYTGYHHSVILVRASINASPSSESSAAGSHWTALTSLGPRALKRKHGLPFGPFVRSPWSSEETGPEAGRYMLPEKMHGPQSRCYFLRGKQELGRPFLSRHTQTLWTLEAKPGQGQAFSGTQLGQAIFKEYLVLWRQPSIIL